MSSSATPCPHAPAPERRRTTTAVGAVLLAVVLLLSGFSGTASASTVHVVKRGDTLAAIARAYQVPGGHQAIASANGIRNVNVIRVGQRLTIPSGSSAARRPAPASASRSAAPAASTGVWDRLAQCESGGRWSINTGNGYYGGLQFSLSSWRAVGGSGMPHQASKAEQIRRAELLKARQGWGAWPACSRKLGLR